jgi:hypothetical protein
MRRLGCDSTHVESPDYFEYPWYCTLPYGHGGTHKAGDGLGEDHTFFYYEW